MSVLSELSVLELDAERGELLPERETLATVMVMVEVPVVIQINLAVLANNVHQTNMTSLS